MEGVLSPLGEEGGVDAGAGPEVASHGEVVVEAGSELRPAQPTGAPQRPLCDVQEAEEVDLWVERAEADRMGGSVNLGEEHGLSKFHVGLQRSGLVVAGPNIVLEEANRPISLHHIVRRGRVAASVLS